MRGLRRLEAVMSATLGRERRLLEYTTGGKLCRMLRNTLQSYPQATLVTTAAGFGALLDDNTYLLIRTSGNLTTQEKRDLLVLFATWLVADPETLGSYDLDTSELPTAVSGALSEAIEPR